METEISSGPVLVSVMGLDCVYDNVVHQC